MAVRKGERGLREQLNRAIRVVRANGVYRKINAKYFKFDILGR